MSPTAEGVLVRGACAAGHVTETRAAKGRVTWQGTCTDPGCELPVRCKRTPKERTPPPPPPGSDSGTTRVVRVADYDATASGAQDDPGGYVVGTATPAELDAAGSESAEPESGPADPLDDDGQRAGRLARWRRRRAERARRPVRYRHPLL